MILNRSDETEKPASAGCPRTPFSPSDYDAGLLNDFGGGYVEWWQDYLRAEIGRANDYWRKVHENTNMELERERNALAEKFTKLDKPKYSGDPMLDSVLGTPNPDFRAWVKSLPPTYWARYDLSAARIGWEAASKFILENAKLSHPLTQDSETQ